MLSLPSDTPVGTQVNVTDAFQFSGAVGGSAGFYYPYGTDSGKVKYQLAGGLPDQDRTQWDSAEVAWLVVNNGELHFFSTDDVEFPWLVTTWQASSGSGTPTTINPVLQELQTPSTAQGGVFATGAGDAAFSGIYTVRGTSNTKPFYNLLNQGDEPGVSGIDWRALGGILGTGWAITDDSGTIGYYSVDAVATPDLATTWISLTASNPAPTVTSITQGELAAGISLAGAGSSQMNGPQLASPDGVRNRYDWTPNFNTSVWDIGTWFLNNTDSVSGIGYSIPSEVAFPWQAPSFSVEDGTPPAPSVDRNDVAAVLNWQTV